MEYKSLIHIKGKIPKVSAFHEAGHIVVYWFLLGQRTQVWIRETLVSCETEMPKLPTLTPSQIGIVSAAGPLAQLYYAGNWLEGDFIGDLQNVKEASGAETWSAIPDSDVWHEAEKLVEELWPEIEKVAEAISEKSRTNDKLFNNYYIVAWSEEAKSCIVKGVSGNHRPKAHEIPVPSRAMAEQLAEILSSSPPPLELQDFIPVATDEHGVYVPDVHLRSFLDYLDSEESNQ